MLTKRVEGEGWAAVCVCVWASLFANEMMVKNIENRLIPLFELLILSQFTSVVVHTASQNWSSHPV